MTKILPVPLENSADGMFYESFYLEEKLRQGKVASLQKF
jgi:hypothetical protein